MDVGVGVAVGVGVGVAVVVDLKCGGMEVALEFAIASPD